jgi:hypothetical protein
LWDCSNSLEIPTGTYVETDCVKWIARFGEDFRKLGVDEKPIPGIAIKTVTKTVEDSIEPAKPAPRKFIPPVVEKDVEPVIASPFVAPVAAPTAIPVKS